MRKLLVNVVTAAVAVSVAGFAYLGATAFTSLSPVAKDVATQPVDPTVSYVWADRPANVECGNGWAYAIVTTHGVRDESQGGCTPVAAPLADQFNGVLPDMLADVSR